MALRPSLATGLPFSVRETRHWICTKRYVETRFIGLRETAHCVPTKIKTRFVRNVALPLLSDVEFWKHGVVNITEVTGRELSTQYSVQAHA